MVSSEWSCIFPLRKSGSIALADRNPSIFARGYSRALICFVKPGDNARRFRPVASMCFVVVRKGAVKRVLPRSKFQRGIILPVCRIWVIEAAVAFCPFFVPGTCAIWREIMSSRLLADPENCRYNACLPRIPLRRPSDGRFSHADFLLFSDGLGLSSERRIDCHEERETKRGNSAAFAHHISNRFPLKHCVKREDLIRVSGINYALWNARLKAIFLRAWKTGCGGSSSSAPKNRPIFPARSYLIPDIWRLKFGLGFGNSDLEL